MASDFIDDGYEAEFYLKASDTGLFGAIRGTFRPPLGKVCDPITRDFFKEDLEKWWQKAPKVMASAIKSWDQKDRHGNTVPITEDAINRMHHSKAQALWMVISLQVSSDPLPDGSALPTVNPEADTKN